MAPKWLVRSGLLLIPAVLAGVSSCIVVRHQERARLERETAERNVGLAPARMSWDQIYDEIVLGGSTGTVRSRLGLEYSVVEGEDWPSTLGEVDGLDSGCDFDELYDHGRLVPPKEKGFVLLPKTRITWVRWHLASSGLWIAVAVVGEDTRLCCKAFPVVAKRKNF